MGKIEYMIVDLMEENGGVLESAKAIEAGISKAQLYSFLEKSDLTKAGQGLYTDNKKWVDGMYLLQLRFPKIVYSFETALYLHDLSEMEPMPLTCPCAGKI